MVQYKDGEEGAGLSVEEEEFDFQHGVSSMWLVTFGVIYIIIMIVSVCLYLVVLRCMALTPRRNNPTLLLVLFLFFCSVVEFGLLVEEFLAMFQLFVFSDTNCQLFTYTNYGNRILQVCIILTMLYYNWAAVYLKTIKYEQQVLRLFPLVVVVLLLLELICLQPALAVRANISSQFCVFREGDSASENLWVFSLLFPYYIPIILSIPPTLAMLLKLRTGDIVDPRKTQVRVSLAISGGYFLFYFLYYLLLLAREVERFIITKSEWQHLLGMSIWHITRPMFLMIGQGWHIWVPTICLTMEKELRKHLSKNKDGPENEIQMEWEGGSSTCGTGNVVTHVAAAAATPALSVVNGGNNNEVERSREGLENKQFYLNLQDPAVLEYQEFHNVSTA